MILNDITQAIGRTPSIRLNRLSTQQGAGATILVKLEGKNPGGSVKDRVALQMIKNAMAQGKLAPGATLIEPTSGNTGVGLAMISAALGLNLIITMPETMSTERRRLIAAYGAKLVLTPGSQGMKGAIAKAQELLEQTPGAMLAGQFVNPANPQAHFETTAQEIWDDTQGNIDLFVAGVGTGGTITGVGRALKQKNAAIRVLAVEPADSPVLSGGQPGPHKIQGIGAGFVPENYDGTVVDEIATIETQEAYSTARALAKSEGILAGISSGAALAAALKAAAKPQWAGKTIVVILPDTGERYLSTELYSEGE